MAKSLKNRIIARLDDTIAYFDRLPAQSGISAGYNKRGVRYFTTIEAIISISGAIDSVKEGRRARKRIIVRPSRYHKGVHELYTYHFPKAWSEACVNNRETIKLAQRLAHDLEHDPVAARPMRLRYLMQFYSPALPAADGSTPKIYERFYQFAYVTILRSLYAAQAAANASAQATAKSATDAPAEESCIYNGVPDTNQRSVCGGESEGIGRFDEHGMLSPCDPIAERELCASHRCPVLATSGSESVPLSSSPARSISCASIPLCASYRRHRPRAA